MRVESYGVVPNGKLLKNFLSSFLELFRIKISCWIFGP